MPWKECHVVEERLRFVARLLDGEKMARLCARVWDLAEDRLQDFRPLQGLRAPRAHRPQPPPLPPRESVAGGDRGLDRAAEAGISSVGRPPRSGSGCAAGVPSVQCPAISTVHAVLDRHGLVTRRGRAAPSAQGHRALSSASAPNDLWCADYKGEFMLADRRYCSPLDGHRLCQPLSAAL